MSNLDVDYQFFEEHVWPELVNRAECFAEAKARCSPLLSLLQYISTRDAKYSTVEVTNSLFPSSRVQLLAPSLSLFVYPIVS